jgi:hypothetical protein
VSKQLTNFLSRTRVLAASVLLLLVSCNVFPDQGDSSLSASLEPDPILKGNIENWEAGKMGLLKFRMVKNNLVGSALFDKNTTIGEFPVAQNGTFNAALPTPTELELLLEKASSIIGKIPCYGSSIQFVPENARMALVYLDLFWDTNTPTQTQLIAANTSALLHYDLAAVSVGSKFAAYAFVDTDTKITADCGLLIKGAFKAKLNLKKGWNLVWLEVVSKGLFNYTDFRISTDGIPDDLKWFTFGQNSNLPTPPAPENPTPFPPAPIVPRATR